MANDDQRGSTRVGPLPPPPPRRVRTALGRAHSTPCPAPPANPPADPIARRAVGSRPDRTRRLGLLVLAVSQLLIVLDAALVNIALPAMASDLRISEGARQWVVTAYALTFAGLLLLGLRVADRLGRRTALIVGLLGLAAASALGGMAANLGTLLVARGLQGAFGALFAPAALALVTTMFLDPHERAKAFAILGAVAGGGSAVGLVLGGTLTEYFGWRSTMFVNIPLALLAVAGALMLLPEGRERDPARLDIVSAALATVGLLSVACGFSRAEGDGWTAPSTLFFLGAGPALLIMCAIRQRLSVNPLLPLRIVADRNRAGAIIAVLLGTVALFGVFFFLSFYLQGVLEFQPVKTGAAFLPVTGGIIVASALVSTVATRVAPQRLMAGGLFGTAAAMFLLSRIEPGSGYGADLLPALILTGLSLGCVFVSAFNASTLGVEPCDAGVASAAVNAAQQVGGGLGLALLGTVASGHAATFLVGRQIDAPSLVAAQVEGYARASLWAGVICLVAGVITLLVVDVQRLELSGIGREPAGAMGPPAPSPAMASAPTEPPGPVPASDPVPFHPGAEACSDTVETMPAALPAPRAEPEPASTPGRVATQWVDEEQWYEGQWPGVEGLEPAQPEAVQPEAVQPEAVQPEAVQPEAVQPEAVQLGLVEAESESEPAVPECVEVESVMSESMQDAVPAARSAVESLNGVEGRPAPASPSDGGGWLGPLVVRGRVRTGSGSSLPDAALTLLDGSGHQVARGTSEGDGAFEFGVREPGEHVLIARKAGHRPHALTVWVNVGSGDVELVLLRGASIAGRVIANWTRLPVRGALVTLADPGGEVVASARTDANGEYEIPEILSGTFTLVVTTPGCRPSAQLLEITGDGRTQHDVEVAGAATLTGIARTPEGRIIVDARVTLADKGGNVVAETFTGEDGRYQFHDLVEGEYTLMAIGYPPATHGVVLGGGQAAAQEITLGHPHGVSFLVD